MIYLRTVRLESVLEHAGIDWERALPGPGLKCVPAWTTATLVRDEEMELRDSKFFKSVRDECDDAGKKGSLFNMLNQLRYAIGQDNYQEFLKGTNVQVKEAFSFEYRSKKHKIWELKFQNKDRLYFFSHRRPDKEEVRLLVLLLFHHKKDQTTPKQVTDYCTKVMKPFLDPTPEFKVIKEKP